MNVRGPTDEEIAETLHEVADLLEVQRANPYRVRAYRIAARSILSLSEGLAELLAREGLRGLERLPGIGRRLASTVEELVQSGRLRLLDRLLGEVSPEALFSTLPGIGERLAERIHDELGLETLEQLEIAVHDGRLESLRGFGRKRVCMLQDALAARLVRSSRRRARLAHRTESLAVPVQLLLGVDAQYRRLAAQGSLHKITPRRFNPDSRAWLPILHHDVGPWSFTALFSNTARAHALGRTDDWVVIHAARDGQEQSFTVVTETRGDLRERRVVRGREPECAALYLETA